jgi:uncharacterized protein YecT (DUF1311 family)
LARSSGNCYSESWGGTLMKRCCGLLIFLTSCLCWTQDSAQYLACSKKANTQHEMHVGANEEAKRVDDELNQVYKLLLSKVLSNAPAAAKIKAAQKAWITYRDAYIDAMYPAKDKQAEYGSIFPMEVDLLGAKLTRQQIGALRDILKQYQEKESSAEH